jgi:hypothetical protein
MSVKKSGERWMSRCVADVAGVASVATIADVATIVMSRYQVQKIATDGRR